MNRGTAKQFAPGHGPSTSIADYDRANALWEALERDLGPQLPPAWRKRLATARRQRAGVLDNGKTVGS